MEKTKIQDTSIIPADEAGVNAIVDNDPKALAQLIKIEKEKRKLLTQYIKDEMVDGVDFGRIHMYKDCATKYDCKTDWHFSKPTLFKAGSEKFCSLLHIRPVFEYEHVNYETGFFVLKCVLLSKSGLTVGEGRGASSVSERQNWTVNNALKIAQKRAQTDAVLRTGGLSDFFTQDLEDMPDTTTPVKPPANGKPVATTFRDTTAGKPQDLKPSEAQLNYIKGLAEQAGIRTLQDFGRITGINKSREQLTKSEASIAIEKLIEHNRRRVSAEPTVTVDEPPYQYDEETKTP